MKNRARASQVGGAASPGTCSHSARTAGAARGSPRGRTTCTTAVAGRSTRVVHIAGFRGTTVAYPTTVPVWNLGGGSASHRQAPWASPGHFASPNTSVRPLKRFPSGPSQTTFAFIMPWCVSSSTCTTSGPGSLTRSQ